MARAPSEPTSRCRRCGFAAASGGDDWDAVESSLGTVTQCPDCGSTDVVTGL